MRPQTVFKWISLLIIALGVFIYVVMLVRSATFLEGMRVGRTTMILSAGVYPVLKVPQASWSAADRARLEETFAAATAEAKESVEALEWMEAYAEKAKMPNQVAAAKALRCPLEETESILLSAPRKITRLVFPSNMRATHC
jgi:hypothetical protein